MPKYYEFECEACGHEDEIYGTMQDDGDGGTEFVAANMLNECMVNAYGTTECECGAEMEKI